MLENFKKNLPCRKQNDYLNNLGENCSGTGMPSKNIIAPGFGDRNSMTMYQIYAFFWTITLYKFASNLIRDQIKCYLRFRIFRMNHELIEKRWVCTTMGLKCGSNWNLIKVTVNLNQIMIQYFLTDFINFHCVRIYKARRISLKHCISKDNFQKCPLIFSVSSEFMMVKAVFVFHFIRRYLKPFFFLKLTLYGLVPNFK